MQVSFYHIMQPDFERSICKLIEKIYNSGLSLIVFFEQKSQVESLNKTLWTFASKSFIPHGSVYDILPESHPILISDNLENAMKLKKADILMVCNSTLPICEAFLELPEKLIYIFHNQDIEILEGARLEYRRLKEVGAELFYYKQEEDGGWVKF